MAKQTDQAEWKNLKSRLEVQDPKALVALIQDLFALSESYRNFLGARVSSDKGADHEL